MKPNTILHVLGLAAAGAAIVLWHSAARHPAPFIVSPVASHPVANQASARTTEPSEKARLRQETDPAELLDQIRMALASFDPSDHATDFFDLLAAVVRADPQAAARFAETNEIAGTRELILHRVAQLWVERDAGAALEWAAHLTASGERDALIIDVCLQVAERDPGEAVRTLSQHTSGENPHGGLEALAQRWAERDFSAASDWALSRPEGDRRDRLIARLAILQAQNFPQKAAMLAAEEIPQGPIQTEAVMAVLHQWAMRDPTAAADWVGLFPEGGLRNRAGDELAGIARSRSNSAH